VTGTALADTDVVVSLCRMGSEPITDEHVDVWLIDSASPDANPHLQFTISDTVRYIAAQRDAGRTVFLHCVRAESRTPTIAAAYLADKLSISGAEALDRVETVLPTANPNARFRAHLSS
jgi:protein-tyrosine phosphatase